MWELWWRELFPSLVGLQAFRRRNHWCSFEAIHVCDDETLSTSADGSREGENVTRKSKQMNQTFMLMMTRFNCSEACCCAVTIIALSTVIYYLATHSNTHHSFHPYSKPERALSYEALTYLHKLCLHSNNNSSRVVKQDWTHVSNKLFDSIDSWYESSFCDCDGSLCTWQLMNRSIIREE